MVPIFGQVELKKIIDNFTIDTMPRTIAFIGEEGCGKTLFTNYLAEKLELPIVNITKDTKEADFEAYRFSPNPAIYKIDLREFTQKAQNTILKFIEEPSEYMRVVVIANSSFEIIPTVYNRCIRYNFATYTKEDLQNFAWMHAEENDLFYEVCTTPGQYLDNDPASVTKLYEHCNKLINYCIADRKCYAGILQSIAVVNLKENYDKFDCKMFLRMMYYIANVLYKNGTNAVWPVVEVTHKYLEIWNKISPLKDHFMTSYFTALWEAVR